MVGYFFDSYAIIEILQGNPTYAKYAQEVMVFTLFNLAEIYWSSLGEYTQKEADEIYIKLRECVVDIDDNTLREAMKLRRNNKKRGLSYADCIGYTYAKQKGLIFLTGDEVFRNIENVEFVK